MAPSRAGLDRRAAWATVIVSATALALTAGVLVPWDWVPGGTLRPVSPASAFTADQIERAEDYAATVRPLALASYAVSVGLACVLGLTPWGAALTSRWTRALPWWVAVPVGVLLLLLVGRLATLPFGLLVRDRNLAEGLTSQSLPGWLGDRALSLLVSSALTAALVLLVVGVARRSPRRWFLWVGSAAVVLTFGVSMAYPVVVEPLFNRFTPLPDGPLKESVLDLAETEGVPVDEVLVADASRRTTTLNAYVSGIAGTRRVVLYDTLVADARPREVRAVVAHELAHARHHDVAVGTALGALGVLLGVGILALLLDTRALQRRAGVDGPGDERGVALVLALVAVGGLLALPAQNAVSRAIEARADRTALVTTDDPDGFEDLQRRLAVRSLADPTPPPVLQAWFGSHPTVLQRLGLPGALERARR